MPVGSWSGSGDGPAKRLRARRVHVVAIVLLVMGFLLVCVGVQFIGDGVVEILSDEETHGAPIARIEAMDRPTAQP